MLKTTRIFQAVAAACALASLSAVLSSCGFTEALAAIPPASRYDGVWIIDAKVSGMLCPRRERRLFLALTGGHVVKVAGVTNPPPRAGGSVDGGGAVSMSLSAMGYVANIHGHLEGRSGAGHWSSNSSLCSGGSWVAHRAS